MSAPPKPSVWPWFLIFGAIVLLVALALPAFTTASFADPLLRQENRLIGVGRALLDYASDNDGRFPPKLEHLSPDPLPAGYLEALEKDQATKPEIQALARTALRKISRTDHGHW